MADAIGSAARLSERASDADLAAACELERSVYVAGDEELRVVFNGERHCYSLRDATRTEPARNATST